MAHSGDGINWTAIPYGTGGSTFPTSTGGEGIRGVAYGDGGHMAHSDDGINWVAIPAGDGLSTFPESNFGNVINGVAYGSGRWVAVGQAGRMAYFTEE